MLRFVLERDQMRDESKQDSIDRTSVKNVVYIHFTRKLTSYGEFPLELNYDRERSRRSLPLLLSNSQIH